MDDLTITRLCADASGIDHFRLSGSEHVYCYTNEGMAIQYNPLTNDAQAMALVKTFRMDVYPDGDEWAAYVPFANGVGFRNTDIDLNRAICLAVAKMQKEKA